MKKIALLLAVCLLLTACFAGCGAKEEPAPAEPSQTEENAPAAEGGMKFAYVANMLSHEFYQRCIKGMEAACKDNNIELVIADSNSEPATQVNNLEIYASQDDIDAILCSPIDPAALTGGVSKAAEKNIPFVSESNAVEGGATMVGAKWFDNGKKMGAYAGEWLKKNNLEGNVLIVGFPAFNDTVQVEAGFTEALNESGATINYIVSVDGLAFKEKAMQVSIDALTANPDVNVIMGINDDSILGAIQAAKSQGLDPTKMLTMSHGLEGNPGVAAMVEEGTLTAAYCLFPEFYGQSMVAAAMAAAKGEELPELYETPMMLLDKDSVVNYYEKVGEDYVLDLDAVKAAFAE